MPNLDQLNQIVKDEITQRAEEGCDVTGFDKKLESAANQAELTRLYADLQRLPIRPDFPYVEPSDLDEIRSHRPSQAKVWLRVKR